MAKPGKYLKEVVKEGKRVRWPNKETLWPSIAVVIVISVIVACFLALWDYLGSSIIDLLTKAFGGM